MSIAGKLKYWLFQPVDRVVVQVPRALVASVLAALLDCVYMVFLVEACRWTPVSAAVLSYMVGGFLQYILCSIWVFPNSPGNKAVGFVSFTVLSVGGLGITWVVMAIGAKLLVPYGIAKFLALGFAFVWNFASRKYLLFNQKADPVFGNKDAKDPNVPNNYTEWFSFMKRRVKKTRPKTMPMIDLPGEEWRG